MPQRLEPAYLTIKNNILDRIQNGELRPGDKIENEQDIAKQYSCARATVNRAIRELAEEGYVERKRRAGTHVADARARATRITIPVVRQQVETLGATYSFSIIERRVEKPNEAIRAALTLDAESPALFVKSLHFANNKPFQLEERWINLNMVPAAKDMAFDHISPNEWLLQTSPYTDAQHILLAENADATQARYLDIKENDAIFVIERRTQLNGQIITYTKLLHAGASFRLAAENFSFSTKN